MRSVTDLIQLNRANTLPRKPLNDGGIRMEGKEFHALKYADDLVLLPNKGTVVSVMAENSKELWNRNECGKSKVLRI